MGRKLSGRFVAGMTVEDAVAACERVNREGIAVSLDSLDDDVFRAMKVFLFLDERPIAVQKNGPVQFWLQGQAQRRLVFPRFFA